MASRLPSMQLQLRIKLFPRDHRRHLHTNRRRAKRLLSGPSPAPAKHSGEPLTNDRCRASGHNLFNDYHRSRIDHRLKRNETKRNIEPAGRSRNRFVARNAFARLNFNLSPIIRPIIMIDTGGRTRRMGAKPANRFRTILPQIIWRYYG